ncbi:hypothetical protein C2W62_22500 [Candidatus Entotheonella serta]|nr:hypothetical protein C2W62_22500 [Candidatus Entotheonella serta]
MKRHGTPLAGVNTMTSAANSQPRGKRMRAFYPSCYNIRLSPNPRPKPPGVRCLARTYGNIFATAPPLSTFNLSPADIARTCTAFTVSSIALNYERFIFPQQAIDEIIVCGGGAENPLLMQLFRQRLQPISVVTPEHYGYPNAALEAIIFAMLAHATMHNRPSNIPKTTGARHPVILGKIVPGRNF